MQDNKSKKVIIFYSLILFIILLLSFFLFKDDKENNHLTSIHAKYRTIEENVLASATLEALDDVDVGSQVSGQIEKIFVVNGQKVKKGDLLVTIDKRIKENDLNKATAQLDLIKAEIEAKKALVERLKRESERFSKLHKQNATSQQSYENIKYDYAIEKANLKGLQSKLVQAQIALSDAKTNLSYTTIKAPIDGYVYAIWVKEGQTVNANQSTPTLVRIASLDKMVLKAKISESDVIKVGHGSVAKFKILGVLNKDFNASLLRIDLASDKNTYEENKNQNDKDGTYYIAHFLVDNTDNLLRLDMSAYITILVDKKENVLSIPQSALLEDTEGIGAILVKNKDGEVENRRVKLGIRDDSFVEVLDNLSEDEEIILTTKERRR